MRRINDVWGTIQLGLRLPDTPAYVPGRAVSKTTGHANYSARLGMRARWAEEVRLVEQAARYAAKPRFVTRAEKLGWR